MSVHHLPLIAPNGHAIRLLMLPSGECVAHDDAPSPRTLNLRLAPLRHSFDATIGPVMVDQSGRHWTWSHRDTLALPTPAITDPPTAYPFLVRTRDGTDGP